MNKQGNTDELLEPAPDVDSGDAINLLYAFIACETDMGLDENRIYDLIGEAKALVGWDAE
jgi:hypothetical protein